MTIFFFEYAVIKQFSLEEKKESLLKYTEIYQNFRKTFKCSFKLKNRNDIISTVLYNALAIVNNNFMALF